MTESIIVYRNPVEAAFWTSEFTFPIVLAIVLAIVVSMVFHNILSQPKTARWLSNWFGSTKVNYWSYHKWISRITLCIAIVTFLTTLYVMV